MSLLVKSELLKLRTTRTAMVFLGAIVVITLLGLILSLALGTFETRDDIRDLLAGTGVVAILMIVFGTVGTAGEHKHGTLTPTLLVAPSKIRILAAKVIAYAIAGLILGAAAQLVTFAVAIPWLHAKDVTVSLSSSDYLELIVGGLLTASLAGAIGIGLGLVIQNQAAAVVTILLVLFVVDNTLIGLAPDVGKFTISSTGATFAGVVPEDKALDWGYAGVVYAGWAAVLCALGALLDSGRDVT